jgi:hypothetical protein
VTFQEKRKDAIRISVEMVATEKEVTEPKVPRQFSGVARRKLGSQGFHVAFG